MSSIYLKSIANYLKCWGIVPSYDFEKNILHHTPRYRVIPQWSLMVICCLATIFSARELLKRPYLFTTTGIILNILSMIGICCMILECSTMAQQWEHIFQQVHHIENVLTPKVNAPNVFYKNPLFQFSLLNLCTLFAIFTSAFANGDSWMSAPQYVYFYLTSLAFFLGISLLTTMKLKLKELNGLFNMTSNFAVRSIIHCHDLFFKLLEIVENFNSLFGRQILIRSLYDFGSILITALYLYCYRDGMPYLSRTHLEIMTLARISSFAFIVITLGMQFTVMLCCDFVVRESEKLLVTCIDLQRRFPLDSAEYRELQSFADTLTKRKISFSAANFFKINRSAMFSMLGTTLTYFITSIQFIEKPNK
ncbi:uncharacterized protein LOC132697009 [Cylas formicarius]|uniref:uncharacterized protein LOC132697009 n=1 Tax=Cylas formicarius TaxID=197179 RepID=UPI00295868FA|nr:uncharacterized protein LOC132697009 [Cylas formicarius]